MSVKGESSAHLFSEISPAVVAGGEFEVHASSFSVARFVFDSNVGHRNLSPDGLESVLFGDGMFAICRIAVFSELCEIAIQVLLQFVVENDAKVSAALTLDLRGLFLIEPVEVGVVMGLAGFGEAVIQSLTLASALALRQKAMAILSESEQLAGTHFLMRNGFHFNETLANEIFHVGSHAIVVPAIDKFREILPGHSAEFPEFHHRYDFRVPEAIGSAAKFMDGAGFTGAACRVSGLAT